MKILITAATLLLTVNTASAAGFSPWTNTAAASEIDEIQNVSVESPGFAPWRDRNFAADIPNEKSARGIVVNDSELNVFRPWS